MEGANNTLRGNWSVGNASDGITAFGGDHLITRNALIGNVWGYFQGGTAQNLTPMTGNNIFGNVSNCGTLNEVTSLDTLVATENYWGAVSGPGPDPADDVCGFAPTTAVPYATKLLPVR